MRRRPTELMVWTCGPAQEGADQDELYYKNHRIDSRLDKESFLFHIGPNDIPLVKAEGHRLADEYIVTDINSEERSILVERRTMTEDTQWESRDIKRKMHKNIIECWKEMILRLI